MGGQVGEGRGQRKGGVVGGRRLNREGEGKECTGWLIIRHCDFGCGVVGIEDWLDLDCLLKVAADDDQGKKVLEKRT